MQIFGPNVVRYQPPRVPNLFHPDHTCHEVCEQVSVATCGHFYCGAVMQEEKKMLYWQGKPD